MGPNKRAGDVASIGAVTGTSDISQLEVQLRLQIRLTAANVTTQPIRDASVNPRQCVRVQYRLRARQAYGATRTITQLVSRFIAIGNPGPLQSENRSFDAVNSKAGAFGGSQELKSDDPLETTSGIFNLGHTLTKDDATWTDVGNPIDFKYDFKAQQLGDGQGKIDYTPPWPRLR
jgi:hypothetical protein